MKKETSKSIQVKTKYTEEGYYTFNRVHYRFMMRRKRLWFLLLLVLSIPLIIAYLFEPLFKNIPFAVLFLLCDTIIIIELFTYLIPDLQVKRTLREDASVLDFENEYTFLKEALKVKNSNATQKVEYTSLYQVIETEDYFYLYLNKVSAFLINKKELTKKEKEEICKLLSEALPKKYHYYEKKKFFKQK